ncbi:glutamate synthase [Desulfosporosinus sp. OT]|uniref:GltB/FmdC/FwdC-like GXGXG domain-containing protein n=1 Tax=Desulfosporosinus sp. OT TaxID=913865 RepID=UPI000223AB7E|nr:glutamate synthase [Desulfosporosinus sp. OT]EGW41771.1 GXGXG motif family protein [Desulfosporosinus sp. OT]
MENLDAACYKSSELNEIIKAKMRDGLQDIVIRNSHSMHNMCVGLTGQGNITIEDSTGLYTASFMEGPRVVVEGNVGWYAGDDMMSGELIIKKNTGCNVGAYINGGTIVIYGSTGSRVGYGMKGGSIIVCGNAGRWAAQMSMGGNLIILGELGQQAGESMYKGAVFTRDTNAVNKLGGNVFLDEATPEERVMLKELFDQYEISADPSEFKVIRPATSGRHKYVLFKPVLKPKAAKKFARGGEFRE